MPRGIPVDEATKARARDLHAAGKGRNEIAKLLGISTFAVTTISKELGFSFDRSQTEVAVRVAVLDRAVRRGAIIDRLYSRAEKVLDRLEAETYSYFIAVPGQGAEKVQDSYPPARDEVDLSRSITAYLVQAVNLEKVDSDRGQAAAVTLLDSLSEAFGMAADALDQRDDAQDHS